MCLAPSTPSLLQLRSRVFSELLKNQTKGQNQTQFSQYASNQHETKSRVKLNSRRMHLRLWKRVGDGLGATSPNPIGIQIEAGQRPVEKWTKVGMIQRTVTQSVLVGRRRDKSTCSRYSPRVRERCCNVPGTLIPELIPAEVEGVQRPVEK